MKTKEIDAHKLRDLLAYDSEELRFLTFYERCEIQKNISHLYNGRPTNFSPTLLIKIRQNLEEIEQSGWERPEYIYKEIDGDIHRFKRA